MAVLAALKSGAREDKPCDRGLNMAVRRGSVESLRGRRYL
jgi:hypothetical protein